MTDYTNQRFSIANSENTWRAGVITSYDSETKRYKCTFDAGGIEYYTIISAGPTVTFAQEIETNTQHSILLGKNVKHAPQSYSVYIKTTPNAGQGFTGALCRALGAPTTTHSERWSWCERGWKSQHAFEQNLQFGLFGSRPIQILKRATKVEAEEVRTRLQSVSEVSHLTVTCIEEPCGHPLSSAEGAGDARRLSSNNHNHSHSQSQSQSQSSRLSVGSDETPVEMIARLRTLAEAGDDHACDRLNTLREHAQVELSSALARGNHENVGAMQALIHMCRAVPSTNATSTTSTSNTSSVASTPGITSSTTLRQTSFSDFAEVLEDIAPELHTWYTNPPNAKLPTSEETINHMKEHCGHQIKTQEEATSLETCCVCMCEFQIGEVATKLPTCSHSFHLQASGDCLGLEAWIKKNDTCPICRAEITTEADLSPLGEAGPSRKIMAQARQAAALDDDGTWVCGGCYVEVRGVHGIDERCPSCEGTKDASRQAYKLEKGVLRKVVVCAKLLQELESMRCPKAREVAALEAACNERERLLNSSALKLAVRSNWQIRSGVKKILRRKEFTPSFYMEFDPNTRVVLKRLWEMWESVVDMNISGINKEQFRHFPVNGIAAHEFAQMTTWSEEKVLKDLIKNSTKMKIEKDRLSAEEIFMLKETATKLKKSGFTFKRVKYDTRVLNTLFQKCLSWPDKKLGSALDLTRMLVLTDTFEKYDPSTLICASPTSANETKEEDNCTRTPEYHEVLFPCIRALQSGKKLPQIMALRTFTNMLRKESIARSVASEFNTISDAIKQVVMSENASNPMVCESVQFLIRNVASTFSQGFVPQKKGSAALNFCTSLLKFYDGSLSIKLNDREGDDVIGSVLADFVAIGTLLSSMEELLPRCIEPIGAVASSLQDWAAGLKEQSVKRTNLIETLEDIQVKISSVQRVVVAMEDNDESLYDDDDNDDE